MASGFHEIRFDPLISYGSEIGPDYSTKITEVASGDEVRIGYWTRGRNVWSVSKEGLSMQDQFYIESFFRARKGSLYGFRLRHWNFYKVVNEPLPLTDNTHAQLQAVYPDALNPETQIITKPVLAANVNADVTSLLYAPDITLERNTGAGFVAYPANGGANWTLDRTTGIITFAGSQAGNTFRWSGSFDFPVRFLSDSARFKRDAMHDHTWNNISMIELKV